MTKQRIIAELRRSAAEDDTPFSGCAYGAWSFALQSILQCEDITLLDNDDLRTFYLLVACALESET